MTVSHTIYRALLCAGLLGLCSCSLTPKTKSDIQRDPRFPDVVAPASFKLAKSDVVVSEGQGHRDFILRYTGRLPSAEVIDFVRDQYSIGNWVFDYSQTLGDRTFIDFRKGTQRCSILVEQFRFSTALTIRVYETRE